VAGSMALLESRKPGGPGLRYCNPPEWRSTTGQHLRPGPALLSRQRGGRLYRIAQHAQLPSNEPILPESEEKSKLSN
jgi:hypothetical protein